MINLKLLRFGSRFRRARRHRIDAFRNPRQRFYDHVVEHVTPQRRWRPSTILYDQLWAEQKVIRFRILKQCASKTRMTRKRVA